MLGLVDHHGARLRGTERLQCELTVRDGKVVYDLNGLTSTDWHDLPAADYGRQGDPRWEGYAPRRGPGR